MRTYQRTYVNEAIAFCLHCKWSYNDDDGKDKVTYATVRKHATKHHEDNQHEVVINMSVSKHLC